MEISRKSERTKISSSPIGLKTDRAMTSADSTARPKLENLDGDETTGDFASDKGFVWNSV